MVIKHLRDAKIQVMNSNDLDNSKKLLDALINFVIEELCDSRYDKGLAQ